MSTAHPSTSEPVSPISLPSRRAFLAGALASAGAAFLHPLPLSAARRRAAALPVGPLFPLGVASGDPTATGMILWTRLITPDPGSPLPGADVAVDWEVATDEAFLDVVASGTAPAVAALAHSVHVDVDGLDPATWYWYRFSADGRSSAVGRTRTFPGTGSTPDEVRFAIASCQNWSDGYYTAYAAMAADDLELVVFLGDYIYESSANRPPRPISLPLSKDLPTYRARYELYKSDPNLQAAHHRFPWILTVDDHEVANNGIGDIGQDGRDEGDPAAVAAYLTRRADAYQVWFEHQPVRLPAPAGPHWTIHRVVEHSDLLRFFVLDGRQYRSGYPEGESQGPDTPKRFDEAQTMLGTAQESWLDQALSTASSRWNAVAQQTVMTAMPIPLGESTFYNFDQWDGYVAARNRLLRSLVRHRVRNPMILSGDIHMAAAAAVRLDFDTSDAPDVAHEIVATSISSRFDPTLLTIVQPALAKIPWARYANADQRGYTRITVTAEEWRSEFQVVAVDVPEAPAATDYVDVIADREPVDIPTTPIPPTTSTPPLGEPEAVNTAPGATPVSGAAAYTG
ncbi:MAG: alkaline phosphatase D family protein [Aquihabitans sp.]